MILLSGSLVVVIIIIIIPVFELVHSVLHNWGDHEYISVVFFTEKLKEICVMSA